MNRKSAKREPNNLPGQQFLWSSGTPRLLVFTPYASARLCSIIGWLRDDFPENRLEQGGLLVGRYVRGQDGSPIQAEVTDILVAKASTRSPGYIEWDAMEETRLQRLFFEMQDKIAADDPVAAEELMLIGWWHTHPNSLAVFMSNTDMVTQRIKCPKPEKYSVVLNPHMGVWRAFAGIEAEEVPAVMLLDGAADGSCATNSANSADAEEITKTADEKEGKKKKIRKEGKHHRHRKLHKKRQKTEKDYYKKLMKKRGR